MSLIGNVQLVAGNAGTVESVLRLLKKVGIEPVGNPDVYVREYASFGVEEARDIASKASSRALSSARRTFVVVTPTMTSEAQNALLKLLEEPAGDALFFFIVPSPQMLLPTLRSRAQLMAVDAETALVVIDVREFLQSAPQARMDMLKPLLEKDEDDRRDLSEPIAFLAALEHELSLNAVQKAEALEAVYRARRYIGDKGSLVKALLEQVALLI